MSFGYVCNQLCDFPSSAIAMVLSALSVFSIWRVPTVHIAVVLVSCVFSAVTVTVFGSLDVVVMNIYDVSVRYVYCTQVWLMLLFCLLRAYLYRELNSSNPCYNILQNFVNCKFSLSFRSTGFGVHSGVGRIGAILGNVMFGHLLDVDRAIPILIVASFLSAGAVAAFFLPPIYRPENRPPLLRCLHATFRRFKTRFGGHVTYRPHCDRSEEQTYGVESSNKKNSDSEA